MVDLEVLGAGTDCAGDNNVAQEECRGIASRKNFNAKTSEGRVAASEEASTAIRFLEPALPASSNHTIPGGRGEVVALASISAGCEHAIAAKEKPGATAVRHHTCATV